ncbi:MAG: SPOR domain-containing protein [Sulfitobacter sp.]
MTFTRLVTIALMLGALSTGAASAQIRQTQPAEFPPSSYSGKQYVDSKGCVFIRAGIDGNISWVPRVTRSRKVVCGFTPTGVAGATAVAPEKTAAAPIEITVEGPDAAPMTYAEPVRKRASAPLVVRQTAPKPRILRQQPAAPAPRSAQVQQGSGRIATSCPGASVVARPYLRGDGRSVVRCGPQAASIDGTTYRSTGIAPLRTTDVTDHTRIVPKHVAIRRLNTTNLTVPKGYRKVWDDGRLNPKRAEQSLAGRAQMLLVWTNTAPQRLINQATGRDLTAKVPLVYPYLDVATQRRELGEVTIVQRDGQVIKRVVRNGRAAPAMRRPVYSSRSTPKARTVPAATPVPTVGNKRFVHIGLFSTKAKARRAAQGLSGMGMGARIATMRHKGKSYLSVRAGPFDSAGATQGAVSRLRGIGYTGARPSK